MSFLWQRISRETSIDNPTMPNLMVSGRQRLPIQIGLWTQSSADQERLFCTLQACQVDAGTSPENLHRWVAKYLVWPPWLPHWSQIESTQNRKAGECTDVWSRNHKGTSISSPSGNTLLRTMHLSYVQLANELNCPHPDCVSCPAGNLGKDVHFFCKFLCTYHTHTHIHNCEVVTSLLRVLLQAGLSLVENGRLNHRPSLLSSKRQFSTRFCPKQRQMQGCLGI